MGDIDWAPARQLKETSRVPNVRRAAPADTTLLQEMLALAADWRPESRVRSITEVMRDPALAHYVAGWPANGDVGFVAEEDRSVGAAWWRFFSADDPGYGFVDDATPEVAIGIRAQSRGQGLGTSLLAALTEEAWRRGVPALSLSVEPDNPAIELYARLGFVVVGRVGSAVTMVRKRVS